MDSFQKTTPNNWNIVKIKDVAVVKSGGNAPQGEKYFQNGKYPFVRVRHFDGCRKYVNRWDLINDLAIKEYKLNLFPKDTIILPKSGASIHLEKRAKLPGECYIVGHLCAINNKSNIDSEYLFYVLKMLKFAQAAGGTTLPYLNLRNISDKEIPFPPIFEQKKIATVLSAVQKAKEKTEEIIKVTKELKKSLMKHLFTYGYVSLEEAEKVELKATEIGMMLEDWEVKNLEEFVESVEYGYSISIPKNEKSDGVHIVSTADISKEGRILYNKIRRIKPPKKINERLRLKSGDILFNWRNSPELIGKTAIFEKPNDLEIYIYASFILRIRCDNNKSYNEYLKYLLNYYRETGVFLKLSRRAVNQANYNRNEINVLKIQVPPFTSQQKIALILSSIDKKIEAEQNKKKALEDLFKTLLENLMSAKIRVNNLEI